MPTGKYTCKDQDVPKQSTGRTPVRNLRVNDVRWLPALAKAEAEDRTLTDVIEDALDEYNAEPIAGARLFTLANWPQARPWINGHEASLSALTEHVDAAVDQVPPEWLTIAAWLATTRHPADPVQQRRILAGHIIGRAIDAPATASWRSRYRDSRHLLEVVQEILDRLLPLADG